MSDNSPPTTIGQALYGPTGPATTPQGPTGMEGEAWRGVPIDSLPTAADPATVVANQPPSKAGQSVGQSLGESARDPSPGPTPEAIAPFTLPEGLEAHPELMAEFSTTTRELKLDRAGAERLLALHAKALQGQSDEWRTQSEAAFSANEMADIRDQFNEAIGDDADANEFRRLLTRTGLGNNAATIRVIGRLLGRR